MLRPFLTVITLAIATTLTLTAQRPLSTAATPGTNSDELFDPSKIGDVHLVLKASDYDALAPKSRFGGFGFGGGRGGGSQSWLQAADGKRNGFASTRGVEFSYVPATVTIAGHTLRDIGVRYKGNGSYFDGVAQGKISLKLDFAEYVKGQRLGSLKKLNLHSNITDASLMNEALAFRLHREAGVPAPRTSYTRVYLTVQGRSERTYAGLFSMVENPDEAFVAARGLPVSGAIFKPVTTNPFLDLGPDWARYNQAYDPKTSLTLAQQQRVMEFARLATRGTDAEFAARVADFLDLEATARYLAVTVFLSDLDGLFGAGQNYYLYLHPRTQRFSFVPWDQDHSFGQFFRGAQADREQLSIHHPWTETNRFLDRLFGVPAFKTLYLARLTEFSTTLFVPDRFVRQVDELAAMLRPVLRDEPAQRLARFEAAVAGQVPPGDAGLFRGANIPIKPFVAARARSIADQLAGRSQGRLIHGSRF